MFLFNVMYCIPFLLLILFYFLYLHSYLSIIILLVISKKNFFPILSLGFLEVKNNIIL